MKWKNSELKPRFVGWYHDHKILIFETEDERWRVVFEPRYLQAIFDKSSTIPFDPWQEGTLTYPTAESAQMADLSLSQHVVHYVLNERSRELQKEIEWRDLTD